MISILLLGSICRADATLLDAAVLPQILNTFKEGSPGTDVFHFRYRLSKDRSVNYDFSISSKGNGTVSLPGITVHLYDDHDDGVYFKDGLLLSSLSDINGDGYTDIVLYGIAVISDEETQKGTQEISTEKELPVVSILRFDVKKNRYRVLLKSRYIAIENR